MLERFVPMVHVPRWAKRYADLNIGVQVVHDLYETFYAMREFIIRDINGFWITFGQPIEK